VAYLACPYMLEVLFWILLFILFYAYFGYGLLLGLWRLLFPKKRDYPTDFFPAVTLVVPAFNEATVIEKKIQNCFLLSYPRQLLTILVITDGSTDNTPQLVRKYPSLVHLHQPERKGKSAALNRAMKEVRSPFVVFTDANTELQSDSIQKMMRHYVDEKTGGVSGEKRIVDTAHTAVGRGERIYWRYESLLKKLSADFYSLIGAAGELFSIRTALFEPLNEDVILDDFVLSARICGKGYRFAYEQEAYTLEAASETITEEKERKVRISAGCFQALFLLKDLLNPVRNGRLFFQYFSHRVLRWVFCPLCIPVILLVNCYLVYGQQAWPYLSFLWLQVTCYLLAFVGWLFAAKPGFPKILLIPYYFVFMNISLYTGFIFFLMGKQSVLWKKAQRSSFSD
jgi:cellulose synthase/poly-beta-1,6-N-acetylglucosamine synthase-like glycosyltransferase